MIPQNPNLTTCIKEAQQQLIRNVAEMIVNVGDLVDQGFVSYDAIDSEVMKILEERKKK